MPALETLAVISYKQPVTGPEIAEIRGVNTSGVLKTLLDKRLITTAGRKEVIGRPILYRTSKEFLMRFGLSDLGELPSLKEFEALAREALGTDEGTAAEENYSGEPQERAADGALDATAAVELENNSTDVSANKSDSPDAGSAAASGGENVSEGVASDALDRGPATVGKDLLEEEKLATSEGMPAGETDEAPKAAVAGE